MNDPISGEDSFDNDPKSLFTHTRSLLTLTVGLFDTDTKSHWTPFLGLARGLCTLGRHFHVYSSPDHSRALSPDDGDRQALGIPRLSH